MPRPKKDAIPFNIRMQTETYDNLSVFCEESGLSKTTAVERILNKYFDWYFSKPEYERSFFNVND